MVPHYPSPYFTYSSALSSKEATPEDIVTNTAYLLFYVRRDHAHSDAIVKEAIAYALAHPEMYAGP